jgi:hypothetical protein
VLLLFGQGEAGALGELDALLHEPGADAHAAAVRLDQQEA